MAQKHYTLLARLANVLRLSYASGGVNALQLASAATGGGPTVSAVGDDTNVDLNLAAKGSGSVKIGGARALTTTDIGSTVQAYDAELAALAGLTSAADSLPYFTGAGTAAATTLTSFARTLLDDASQAAMRTTLALTPGTDVQAQDAELTAIAGLTSAANKLPYFTGSGTAALLDVNATPAATTVPVSASDKRLADGFMRLREFGRRSAAWQHDIGATTVSARGTTATLSQVGTGTASSADTTSSPYEQQQTGTTTGNTAGRETSATVTQRSWHPILAVKILTGANIQNIGYWFGFSSATLAGVDTPTTQHVAAFRYNITVDGTAFWRCVTCDGATATVTTTSTAIATSTVYRLRIELDDTNTEARFYVNDALVATHGSANNPPAQTTQLGVVLDVTTKANAAKRFAWDFINLVQGLPF